MAFPLDGVFAEGHHLCPRQRKCADFFFSKNSLPRASVWPLAKTHSLPRAIVRALGKDPMVFFKKIDPSSIITNGA
jgi:hypothetical protein